MARTMIYFGGSNQVRLSSEGIKSPMSNNEIINARIVKLEMEAEQTRKKLAGLENLVGLLLADDKGHT